MKRILSLFSIMTLVATGTTGVVSCATRDEGYDLNKFDASAISDIDVTKQPSSGLKEFKQSVTDILAKRVVTVLQSWTKIKIYVGDLSITIVSWPEVFEKTENSVKFQIDAMPESLHFKNYFVGTVNVHSVIKQSDISGFAYQWPGNHSWTGGSKNYDSLLWYFDNAVLTKDAVKSYAVALNLYLSRVHDVKNNYVQWDQIYKQRSNIFSWYYVDGNNVEHLINSQSQAVFAFTGTGNFALHINGDAIHSNYFIYNHLSGFAVGNFSGKCDLSGFTVAVSEKNTSVKTVGDKNELFNEITDSLTNDYLPLMISKFFGGGDAKTINSMLKFDFELEHKYDDDYHRLVPDDLDVMDNHVNGIMVTIKPKSDVKNGNIFINSIVIHHINVANRSDGLSSVDAKDIKMDKVFFYNMKLDNVLETFKTSASWKALNSLIVSSFVDIPKFLMHQTLMIEYNLDGTKAYVAAATQAMLDDAVVRFKHSGYDGARFFWRITSEQTYGMLDSATFSMKVLNQTPIAISPPASLQNLSPSNSFSNVMQLIKSQQNHVAYQLELVKKLNEKYDLNGDDKMLLPNVFNGWNTSWLWSIITYTDAAHQNEMTPYDYRHAKKMYILINFRQSVNQTLNHLTITMTVDLV